MNPSVTAAWLCILSPLVGVALTPVLARFHVKARDLGAVAFSLVAAGAALSLLPALYHPEALPLESSLRWLESPLRIGFGVLIDPLSIVLVNVVAVVSSIIMVYCLGYMKGDPGQTRFWMWMNGFIGSMTLLVLSNNLLFVFVGWKLVGVCSYGLIGYYYRDRREYWIGGPPPNEYVKPSQASLKALVVTSTGDMLMLGGILILYFYAGTLSFSELYETSSQWVPRMAASPGMIALTSILLLAGPAGKSAQFPFHEWLPEAMAGPGPVSALIHAATMVKSGVYLVGRLLPLFYYARWVAGAEEAAFFFQLTAWIGAFTALLAATQGMVAMELKKILAYSTVSQIGYMMLGLGIAGMAPGLLLSGMTSGMFHLVSHALFKACLFLCAGTVIHAVHSFYIQEMGALRKFLPLTFVFTLLGALSLMGVPPFPGFWSKDAVLLATFDASFPLFALGLATVGITAFYTVRFVAVVFFGPKSENVSHAEHEGGELNDGTISMRVATGLLALMILVAGIGGPSIEHALHEGFEAGVAEELAVHAESEGESSSHSVVPILSVCLLVLGALPAYYLYFARKASPGALMKEYPLAGKLYDFFWKRWYINAVYRRVFIDGTTRLASFIAEDVEDFLDRLVNRKLPVLFHRRALSAIARLNTETEELLYNVSYVLVIFVLFLVFLFFGIRVA